MGVLDVFKRRKKDEFMELEGEAGSGRYGPAGFPREEFPRLGPAPAQPVDMGLPEVPAQPMADFTSRGSSDLRRDIETLSYKLDSLKSALDNISARLSAIESALRTQPAPEKPESGWTY